MFQLDTSCQSTLSFIQLCEHVETWTVVKCIGSIRFLGCRPQFCKAGGKVIKAPSTSLAHTASPAFCFTTVHNFENVDICWYLCWYSWDICTSPALSPSAWPHSDHSNSYSTPSLAGRSTKTTSVASGTERCPTQATRQLQRVQWWAVPVKACGMDGVDGVD